MEDTRATPVELAKELGVKATDIRGWLRREHPRPEIEYRTRWHLSDDEATAVRRQFGKP